MKVFMLAAALVGSTWARCPNDCNGKGTCNSASVCECYTNYMGNDCSQRVCTFGKAWIDTNLGDLNANGLIDTDQQVFMGFVNTLTGEQYDPNYAVARTSNTAPWDEAHFYRECSNKGICNRKTGLCDCFPGFEGNGCRRMSCPLDCNGHGKCQLVEDERADYTLWDQDKVQGCSCDPGYTGPDCSIRECPMGADPVEFTYTNVDAVYKLEFPEVKAQKWDEGKTPNGPTFFTITYTDEFGDEWTTHAITLYYQANCHADVKKWDPETLSTATCTSTAFVAKPTTNTSHFGYVRASTFLDDFYNTNFLFDDSFVGEQVNNTLKHLPNDKIRNPYVWTVYNPVEFVGTVGSPTSPNADKGFLYPAASVPNFDEFAGVGGVTPITGKDWWRCHSEIGGTYCSDYSFGQGPSSATDAPNYRFPIFASAGDLSGAHQDIGKAAASYLSCPLWSVCIFIRISGARGSRKMGVNYHYKPASYLLKAGKKAPQAHTPFEANSDDYEIIYGAERRGNDQSSGTPQILKFSSVGATRVWVRELDGDPVIEYKDVTSGTDIHACSRRGLCDYNTGRCDCFFGYTGNNCHIRTPSEMQGL